MQLRLVGILMLLFVLARSLVPLLLSFDTTPIQRLSSLTSLSASLPLLPLGISLYLLGGGRKRLPNEFPITTLVHRSLVPLALACLLLLPILTVKSGIEISHERSMALAEEEALQINHRQWLAEAEKATSSPQVRSIADLNGLQLPMMANEPVEISRWRLSQVLERDLATLRRDNPVLLLTPYQLEILSVGRIISTLLLQLIAGAGLLLLQLQSKRQIESHGLNPKIFFRLDQVRRRRSAAS